MIPKRPRGRPKVYTNEADRLAARRTTLTKAQKALRVRTTNEEITEAEASAAMGLFNHLSIEQIALIVRTQKILKADIPKVIEFSFALHMNEADCFVGVPLNDSARDFDLIVQSQSKTFTRVQVKSFMQKNPQLDLHANGVTFDPNLPQHERPFDSLFIVRLDKWGTKILYMKLFTWADVCNMKPTFVNNKARLREAMWREAPSHLTDEESLKNIFGESLKHNPIQYRDAIKPLHDDFNVLLQEMMADPQMAKYLKARKIVLDRKRKTKCPESSELSQAK